MPQQVSALRGKHIDAEFLRELLVPDPERDLLRWLDDPQGTRSRWDAGRWSAFRGLARDAYGFDPETDGPLVGVVKLGYQRDAWRQVWGRFAEAPEPYGAPPDLLRRAKHSSGQATLLSSESWPQDNEYAEDSLRLALLKLHTGTPSDCRKQLCELGDDNGARRGWVWAKLRRAPLAVATSHLSRLAQLTEDPLVGATPRDIAEAYWQGGWKVDAAPTTWQPRSPRSSTRMPGKR